MKPAAFNYIEAVDEAQLAVALAEHGDQSRLLAGGQSLVPMMNFRVVCPAVIIDINRVSSLSHIELIGSGLRIGALTRHAEIEDSAIVAERCPLLRQAVRNVAHRTVRNRGTIGGSVALAYPGAEVPLALMTLGAEVRLVSQRGERRLPIAEFVLDALDTAIESDEYIQGFDIELPPAGSAASFVETSRRHGDFAIGAAAVVVGRDSEGRLDYMRAGVSGGTGAPIRLGALEEAALAGGPIANACVSEIQAIEVFGDSHYPEGYRRHVLTGILKAAMTNALRDSGGCHVG